MTLASLDSSVNVLCEREILRWAWQCRLDELITCPELTDLQRHIAAERLQLDYQRADAVILQRQTVDLRIALRAALMAILTPGVSLDELRVLAAEINDEYSVLPIRQSLTPARVP